MTDIGKTIVIFGVILIIIGLVLSVGPKIPLLGKLPGDIFIKRDGFSFYFPLTTSFLVSILLTIVFSLFGRK